MGSVAIPGLNTRALGLGRGSRRPGGAGQAPGDEQRRNGDEGLTAIQRRFSRESRMVRSADRRRGKASSSRSRGFSGIFLSIDRIGLGLEPFRPTSGRIRQGTRWTLAPTAAIGPGWRCEILQTRHHQPKPEAAHRLRSITKRPPACREENRDRHAHPREAVPLIDGARAQGGRAQPLLPPASRPLCQPDIDRHGRVDRRSRARRRDDLGALHRHPGRRHPDDRRLLGNHALHRALPLPLPRQRCSITPLCRHIDSSGQVEHRGQTPAQTNFPKGTRRSLISIQ